MDGRTSRCLFVGASFPLKNEGSRASRGGWSYLGNQMYQTVHCLGALSPVFTHTHIREGGLVKPSTCFLSPYLKVARNIQIPQADERSSLGIQVCCVCTCRRLRHDQTKHIQVQYGQLFSPTTTTTTSKKKIPPLPPALLVSVTAVQPLSE